MIGRTRSLADMSLHAGPQAFLDFHQAELARLTHLIVPAVWESRYSRRRGLSRAGETMPWMKKMTATARTRPYYAELLRRGARALDKLIRLFDSNPDRQPDFLSFGFRPFFLLAGIFSVLAMGAWLVWLALHYLGAVIVSPTIGVAAHLWHGHEMLFGYAVAVISGFMLTAVPSWTGARRIAGAPLAVMAAIWIAGRIAVWFSALLSPLTVMLIDMAYLPVLALAVAAGLLVRPAPRNLIFLGLLALLIFANGAVHAQWTRMADDTASWGLTLAILTISLIIVIIGGRIVPSFTRNALMRRGESVRLPRSYGLLDKAAIISVALIIVSYILSLPALLVAILAAIAALANIARLALWRTFWILDEPIVWVMHMGYAFIGLGLGAVSAAFFFGEGQTSAIHILGIGAVGGMSLAIMSRAALGHTGRPLKAGPATVAAYGLIAAAALVRGMGIVLFPDSYFAVTFLGGGLWTLGFGLFVIVYLPILTGPSQKDASPT